MKPKEQPDVTRPSPCGWGLGMRLNIARLPHSICSQWVSLSQSLCSPPGSVCLLNALLWAGRNGLPPTPNTLHLGCSYHLQSSHHFLSTWGAVMLEKVKRKERKNCISWPQLQPNPSPNPNPLPLVHQYPGGQYTIYRRSGNFRLKDKFSRVKNSSSFDGSATQRILIFRASLCVRTKIF